ISTGQFGSSALIDLATWLGLWLWIPAIFLPTYYVFVLFPDGRLPEWGGRVTAWLGVLGVVATSAGLAFLPGPLATWATPANPYGLPALAAPLSIVLDVGSALLAIGVVASAATLVSRYRRATGPERRQLDWLVYAAVMLVAAFIASGLMTVLFPGSRLATEVSIVLTNLAVLGIAVAAGVAILYHRLYDIDVIVNRTLVYGALTAVVAT